MNRKKGRLSLETLEDRLVLTAWGTPWPGQLTVSFVPDGTAVGSQQSATPQGVSVQAWKGEILRALQTWAANANVNVGLVNDGGQPLGTPGRPEGDTRFGDIRIAAVPLGAQSSLAVSAPFDPLAGTEAGDIIFNSSQPLSVGGANGYDVFSVALHEAGHVLGFADESTDPTSALYDQYTSPRTGLSAGDVTKLQALYGARTADAYEGTAGNATLASATSLGLPDVAARVSSQGDVDTYRYRVPFYATGPLTVKVQTSGLSLLTPSLRVYDSNSNLVGSSSATDPLSGDVSVTVANAPAGSTFYFQVQGARSDVFGVGSYRLKVDTGAVSRALISALDVVLDDQNPLTYNDGHNIQTVATARQLDTSAFASVPGFSYAINATLADAGTVNFYRITTPATALGALVFSAAATRGSTLDPELSVYDGQGNAVATQVLSNDSGSYTVQLLNPSANATYYVALRPSALAPLSNRSGSYLLGADYRATPIVLDTIVQNTLSATQTSAVTCLQTSEAMLYHFVLSFTAPPSSSPVALALQMYDQNSNLVFTLVCMAGQTVSTNALLGTGTYSARFVAATQDGSALSNVSYSLLGSRLTDPLDPLPIPPTDPTMPPPPPTDPTPLPPVVVIPPVVTLPPLPPIGNPWIPT